MLMAERKGSTQKLECCFESVKTLFTSNRKHFAISLVFIGTEYLQHSMRCSCTVLHYIRNIKMATDHPELFVSDLVSASLFYVLLPTP